MARSVIITCALTGGADTKGINPAVPAAVIKWPILDLSEPMGRSEHSE